MANPKNVLFLLCGFLISLSFSWPDEPVKVGEVEYVDDPMGATYSQMSANSFDDLPRGGARRHRRQASASAAGNSSPSQSTTAAKSDTKSSKPAPADLSSTKAADVPDLKGSNSVPAVSASSKATRASESAKSGSITGGNNAAAGSSAGSAQTLSGVIEEVDSALLASVSPTSFNGPTTLTLSAITTKNTAGTNLHVNAGCIYTEESANPVCAGNPLNIPDQGTADTSVFIFACLPSDTTDQQTVPGCQLQASWPRSLSDVFLGDGNCLLDSSSSTISSQCATSAASAPPLSNPYFQSTTSAPPTTSAIASATPTLQADPAACSAALQSVSKVSCASDSLDLNDWLNLVQSVQSNSFGTGSIQDPYPLDASSSVEFGLGSTQFCTENDFLFENTHLPLHNVAEAAIAIACQCCTTATCGGGEATIEGDDGLSLITKVKSTNEECGGSLQFTPDTLKKILDGVEDVVKLIQKVAQEVEDD